MHKMVFKTPISAEEIDQMFDEARIDPAFDVISFHTDKNGKPVNRVVFTRYGRRAQRSS